MTTPPTHKQKLEAPLFPAVSLKNAELEANFGASPWQFPPPEGYRGFHPSGDGAGNDGLVPWTPPPEPESTLGHGPRRPLALILEPTRCAARVWNPLAGEGG